MSVISTTAVSTTMSSSRGIQPSPQQELQNQNQQRLQPKELKTYCIPVNKTAASSTTISRKSKSTSRRLGNKTTSSPHPENEGIEVEKENDQIAALRLIADSIAQQRQHAARAIILHPLVVAITIGVTALFIRHRDECAGSWALVSRFFSGSVAAGAGIGVGKCKGSAADYTILVTTFAGLVMAALAGVGYFTTGYLEVAERTGTWRWLRSSSSSSSSPSSSANDLVEDGHEDLVIVTKYGEEIIGTVVLRGVNDKMPSRTAPGKVTGQIRAWTVGRRYRHSGIGTGLLEEAVRICKDQRWNGPVFAESHAHATRLLWLRFHRSDENGEEMARSLLDEIKTKEGS